MKKFLSYILILIVSVGVFSPAIKIQAAYDTTTDGECTVRTPAVGRTPPSIPAILDGYTEARCHTETLPMNTSASVEFVGWNASSSVPCVPPLSKDTAGGGLCICQLPWGELKNGVCVIPGTQPPATPPLSTSTTYTLLAPLPCDSAKDGPGCVRNKLTTFDPVGDNKIGGYLNLMIKIFIGICAVLAMIMIVMGGIEYMTTELISSKEAGKEKIRDAIFGLILALGAWTLLYTINPDILNTDLSSLQNVTVTVEPLYDRGATDLKQSNGESIRCTPVLSGPCSVDNLTPIFGDKAVAMSKICNMESGGTSIASGTDFCSPPGRNLPFSFGLFQVNLAANGILAGADCVGLFDRAVSSTDAIAPKYTSGFSCSLLSGKETLYSTCKANLLDTNTNLAIAKSLFFNPNGINNWVGDKKYCASAFN